MDDKGFGGEGLREIGTTLEGPECRRVIPLAKEG
jgi:hypothetical protein